MQRRLEKEMLVWKRYPVSQLWPEGFDLETADKKLIEYDAWYKKLKRRRTT